ncbi:hypothetical protein HDU67_001154 [Dinochytrium kinnereticum]|nr:hypothetical protein HDU67_001154 [Dinochytrium kinnereticum]
MSAPLASYGLKTGSKIMMIGEKPTQAASQHPSPNASRTPSSSRGSNAHHPYPQPSTRSPHHPTPTDPPKPAAPQPTAEEMSKAKLEEILQGVHATIVPMIESYSTQATAYISGNGSGETAQTEKQLKFEHSKIGELLLQALLKIDGVQVPAFNDGLRLRRKECVREINALLDRTDGIKERVLEVAKGKSAL